MLYNRYSVLRTYLTDLHAPKDTTNPSTGAPASLLKNSVCTRKPLSSQSSLQGCTTAALDCLAGNVFALGRDKERDELRNIFWLLNTAELDVALHPDSLSFSNGDALL